MSKYIQDILSSISISQKSDIYEFEVDDIIVSIPIYCDSTSYTNIGLRFYNCYANEIHSSIHGFPIPVRQGVHLPDESIEAIEEYSRIFEEDNYEWTMSFLQKKLKFSSEYSCSYTIFTVLHELAHYIEFFSVFYMDSKKRQEFYMESIELRNKLSTYSKHDFQRIYNEEIKFEKYANEKAIDYFIYLHNKNKLEGFKA